MMPIKANNNVVDFGKKLEDSSKKLSKSFQAARPVCDYDNVKPEVRTARLHRDMKSAARFILDDPDALDADGNLVHFAIPSVN